MQVVADSTEIVRARLSDGAVQPVTRTRDRDEIWPYWSEPAKRLVFQVTGGKGQSDLVLWSKPRGEQLLGATKNHEERWPAWSPVAPDLAYAFLGENVPRSGIALADFGSGEHELLARGGPQNVFLRPSWAPDGSRLVAQRRLRTGQGSNLWLIAPGAPAERLTRDPRWLDSKPFFTRDGKHIVYSRERGPGPDRQIVIRALDGDTRRLAALGGASDHSARPSPTRDEVVFVSDRSGRPQIHLVQLETGAVRQLGDIPGAAFAPRWSPDGELLAVTIAPPGTSEPRLADQESLASARVAVIDRQGNVRLEIPGLMPDWMAPWR